MNHSDELIFQEESSAEESLVAATSALPTAVWQILIVDDDPDVHSATKYALKDLNILDRPLSFLHAHTGQEGIELLQHNPSIAVVLLDVVMETEDAGFALVNRLRKELNNSLVRIILRTGQPGYAPELDAIRDYDINDYKTKSELTRTRLYTSLVAAIRCYAQLNQLHKHRQGLERIIESTRKLIGISGLGSFADGVLTQLGSLFGERVQGLVCVLQHQHDHDEQSVIAASGTYRTYYQRPLHEIDDIDIRNAIITCLSKHQSLEFAHGSVIYFEGEEQEEFAIFLDIHGIKEGLEETQLQMFCQNLSICAKNLHLINRLHDSAFVDAQLHIPNRTALVDVLSHQQFIANHALVLIDVVQFAELNETFGFSYGDQLLHGIVERLKRKFEHHAIIARIGGDVFALVGDKMMVAAEKVQELFHAPFTIDEQPHTATICTGTVTLDEVHHKSAVDLLKGASIALKVAKSKGPGSNVQYDAHIGVESQERTMLLHQLRAAFESDRLFLAFQPQVSLDSGELVGFEALMRWRNDNGEFVRPDRFISIAEHSGLIVPLGLWALHSALRLHKELIELGHGQHRMAVNVSPVQLQSEQFSHMVIDALHKHQIAPQWLEIEVTEGIALLGADRAIQLLQQLRDIGVSIALDDFGTGYSSLSYVQQLPLTRLKIDRSFVSPMDGQTPTSKLVNVVIDMGKKLGLTVLAEGVETEQQMLGLKALGCHEAQGFYFSRPMDRDALLNGYFKSDKIKTDRAS